MFISVVVEIFSWSERWNFEMNGTYHLSKNENICFIVRMRKHTLYLLYNLYKDSNSLTKFKKKKALKNDFSFSYSLQAARPTLRAKYYEDAYVTLNARTAPVTFALRRVSHVVFLISLVLEQTSEHCIRNTEHPNINVNDECNSK